MNSRIALDGLATVAICICLLLIGCRPSEFQYVEGVVTLDGAPLEGATVTFRPREKGGMTAAGLSDASGRYRLNPLRGTAGAGAMIGEYDVTVVKFRVREAADMSTPSKVEYLTPTGYADAATSGLKATIKPGRNSGESVSFALRSDFQTK